MTAYRSLGYEVAKVHKALRARFQRVLTPYGVTVQQFEVMRELKTKTGLTAAQLVESVISDSSTMMSILKRLESKALIVRRPDENDRRTKMIHLTENGQNLVKKLMRVADQHNRRVENCCSPEELQIFRQILSKLYTHSQDE